ncbi:hypothetical protein [Oceanirhabdus seepicola]|uniref:Uncharacterized protein n=1 Tax=Oceanirhabdus seepicola TaxID=2828781 RepID=A0A9J6NY47_9CLOT|nr:hypothetical protein [Oceanirhabdus seepicola]MCM1988557.1 hypothetical protein [Oceanirhabdus seepicola]
MRVAILHWSRMAEFTADRAGLLACQNIDAPVTTTMKIAGLPLAHNSEVNLEEFKNKQKSSNNMITTL